MIFMKYALFHMYHHVCITYYSIFQCVSKKIILDQRGISQEVSLVTKHGVEAKSYEGVSDIHILILTFILEIYFYRLLKLPS